MRGRISSIHCLRNGFSVTAGAGGASGYTSELAARVGLEFFSGSDTKPSEVDYLILCTQTPDFRLPTTACLVQSQVGLRSSVGAIDLAGGVPSFVFALALAQGLIASNQAQRVMIITADTDASSGSASALLVIAEPDRKVFDGFAFDREGGSTASLETVLTSSGSDWASSEVVLLSLLGVQRPDYRSSTLPIALSEAISEGRVSRGDKLVLLGSDVAGSWAGAVVTW